MLPKKDVGNLGVTTYEMVVFCSNCGKVFTSLKIPLGQKITDTECPDCMCNTLVRAKRSIIIQ